ncbi:hypothetical protein D3C83_264620 [compost metagenome]
MSVSVSSSSQLVAQSSTPPRQVVDVMLEQSVTTYSVASKPPSVIVYEPVTLGVKE